MIRRYHLPGTVTWTAEPPEGERAVLERAVLAALHRAIRRAAGPGSTILPAPNEREAARQAFDPARFREEGSAYRLPSYNDEGAEVEVPVETIEFEEPAVVTSTLNRHPAGPVAVDRLVEGPSPFEGQMVVILPNWQTVLVHSDRYAISTGLSRAVRWGQMLFGARSFVILEGSFGRPDARYYTLGVNAAIASTQVPQAGGVEVPGGQVYGMGGRYFWNTQFSDPAGNVYLFRALLTRDDYPLFPPILRLAEEFYTQLDLTLPEQAEVPRELAGGLVFGEINRLLADRQIEEAARRLAELDAHAFALLDWETKSRYLQILVEAWTREPQEIAIIEILKSVPSLTELRAIQETLRQAGIYDQLFSDMDSQLWSLLTTVAEHLGSPEPVTFQLLVELMQEAGLLPRDVADLAQRVMLGPSGIIVTPMGLAEMEEAARSFVRFLGGAVEGVWMLLSEPDKVVEGIAQLVRLIVVMYAAQLGHQQSLQEIEGLLLHIGQQLLYGYRGARLLGVIGRVLTRVKWALIWEIASMFIGVGEVEALLRGLGLTRRAAALGRLARVLRGLNVVTELEPVLAKLDDLARLVRMGRQLGSEADILRLFSYLPEDDLARLARALERAKLERISDWAALAARHPELSEAAEFAARRAEALLELERRLGGLSDEVVAGFQRLAGWGGLTHDELLALARALPPENGGLFMRAVRGIPDQALGRRVGARTPTFFHNLARSPKVCSFLIDAGYDTFSALYRHSGYDLARFEESLDALADIGRTTSGPLNPADYRRFLDRLRDGDTTAYRELRDAVNARRATAGLRPIRTFAAAELDEIVRTTPDIRRIRELAAQMDNSSSGSLFERWANHYVFHRPVGSPRPRVSVNWQDNPHLQLFGNRRTSDFYLGEDGSLWDTKIYQYGGDVGYWQVDDYLRMEEAGWVITTDGRRVEIRSINYLFSDRAAAEVNHAIGADIWYIDDIGNVQLLP
jgi:hypothetical protein